MKKNRQPLVLNELRVKSFVTGMSPNQHILRGGTDPGGTSVGTGAGTGANGASVGIGTSRLPCPTENVASCL